tara:strand:+ start:186 stop:1439 length:1254 start_codon:yes stop_codon:yes gene_type:complete
MPYIAPKSSGMAVLAGALGGTSRAGQQLLEHRWKQKESYERRRMHQEKLEFSRQQLESQIQQSNLDRASRESMSQLNRELEERLKTTELASLEERAQLQAETSIARGKLQKQATVGAASIRAREQRRQTEARQAEYEAEINNTGELISWANQVGFNAAPVFESDEEESSWLASSEGQSWTSNLGKNVELLAQRMAFNRPVTDVDRQKAENFLGNYGSIRDSYNIQLTEMTMAKNMGRFAAEQKANQTAIDSMLEDTSLVKDILAKNDIGDKEYASWSAYDQDGSASVTVVEIPQTNWADKWTSSPLGYQYSGIFNSIDDQISRLYQQESKNDVQRDIDNIEASLDMLKGLVPIEAYNAIRADVHKHFDFKNALFNSGTSYSTFESGSVLEAEQLAIDAAYRAIGETVPGVPESMQER